MRRVKPLLSASRLLTNSDGKNSGQSRPSELSPGCGGDGGRLDGLRGWLAFAALALGCRSSYRRKCGTLRPVSGSAASERLRSPRLKADQVAST